jgi:hypothetical protein
MNSLTYELEVVLIPPGPYFYPLVVHASGPLSVVCSVWREIQPAATLPNTTARIESVPQLKWPYSAFTGDRRDHQAW